MIKNILLALDPDDDTPIAIDYACKLAHIHSAFVTGITVVDMKRIEKQSYGGGIGSMYYGEKLKEQWIEKTRSVAQELISTFSDASTEEHISFRYEMQEGNPSEKILAELCYHDVLILGKSPHFFYAHPEEKTTTLTHIVKNSVSPVIIVPDEKVEVNQVVIAYDGSLPSARAMQRFCQLNPFGKDVEVHVVNVYHKSDEDHSALLLAKAIEYITSWGYNVRKVGLRGTEHYKHLIKYSDQVDASLIVAGAHSVSKLSKLAFGSTTASFIDNGNKMLFLER